MNELFYLERDVENQGPHRFVGLNYSRKRLSPLSSWPRMYKDLRTLRSSVRKSGINLKDEELFSVYKMSPMNENNERKCEFVMTYAELQKMIFPKKNGAIPRFGKGVVFCLVNPEKGKYASIQYSGIYMHDECYKSYSKPGYIGRRVTKIMEWHSVKLRDGDKNSAMIISNTVRDMLSCEIRGRNMLTNENHIVSMADVIRSRLPKFPLLKNIYESVLDKKEIEPAIV